MRAILMGIIFIGLTVGANLVAAGVAVVASTWVLDHEWLAEQYWPWLIIEGLAVACALFFLSGSIGSLRKLPQYWEKRS